MKKPATKRPAGTKAKSEPKACCGLPRRYEHIILPLADLFQHLSDPCRLRLLLILSHGEHPVGTLANHLGVTPSAVSHQLQTLRRARLVAFRRDGQTLYYRLNDSHVKQLVDTGREHILEAE